MKSLGFVWCAAFFVLVTSTDRNRFSEEDYNIVFPNGEDQGTLKLVNVLFRHGNRTPNGVDELYPNDPHLNYTYFPYGYGQLTNSGKLKLYTLGVTLRNRYNSFLGKYYYPEIVEAISTDYNRTKMSLELVLAGLFPPRQEELMTVGLPWQPIPYNYVPRSEDKVLLSDESRKYKNLLNQYISNPKVQLRFKPHQNMFNYISEHTGKDIHSFHDIYNLFFGLSTEEEYGLTLPEWTETVWPEPITSLAVEHYFISMGLPNMKKMLVGYFLEKIIKDAKIKMQDDSKLSRKMHLYSAHENNLAQLLIALGVFGKRHIPTYGSYIVLELHEIDDVYGFKVFYEAWDGSGLRQMKISQCNDFCPMDIFENLISDYLPISDLDSNFS